MERMRKPWFAVILAMIFTTALTLAGQSPREAFKELLGQLAQNPSDDTLREKVVQAAANLDPAPAIPEEARRYYIEGMTLHQEAKSPDEEKVALDSYAKALQLAPWWGEIYLGQSVSQELAGQLDAAEKSLHLYLVSNPAEEKARSAQDHIYVLEAKKKKAQATVQASSEQVEQRKSLKGWWQCKSGCGGYWWMDSDGRDLKTFVGRWAFEGHFEQDAITGLATLSAEGDAANPPCVIPEQKHRMTAFVEDNGKVIRLKYELTTYQGRAHTEPDPIMGNLSPHHICDSITPVSTSPQEIVFAGGAKESEFGAGIATITPGMQELPTDKETTNAVKDGFHACKRSQKSDTGGVLVNSVAPSSAAAAGGLKAGDILHIQSEVSRYDKNVFCTAQELQEFLWKIPPGGKFSLEVFDGSKRPKVYGFVMGVRGESVDAIAANQPSNGKKHRRK
jgi:hypothetical protein